MYTYYNKSIKKSIPSQHLATAKHTRGTFVYDFTRLRCWVCYTCIMTNNVRGKTGSKSARSRIIEAIGWYGVAAILLAYVLVSFDVIAAQSWEYQLLNLTGASGVLVISYMKQARQPALLNLVWAVIALAALIGLALK